MIEKVATSIAVRNLYLSNAKDFRYTLNICKEKRLNVVNGR